MDDSVRKGLLLSGVVQYLPKSQADWTRKALEGKNVKDLLLNVGSGGGAAAAPAAAADGGATSGGDAAADKKEEKEEEKEESDEDMGFGLFD